MDPETKKKHQEIFDRCSSFEKEDDNLIKKIKNLIFCCHFRFKFIKRREMTTK